MIQVAEPGRLLDTGQPRLRPTQGFNRLVFGPVELEKVRSPDLPWRQGGIHAGMVFVGGRLASREQIL